MTFRILIVDDVLSNRKLLELYFREIGSTTIVSNGTEAVRVFAQCYQEGKPFDLICLDLIMPDLDGSSVLLKMREFEEARQIEQAWQVPVILISSEDDPKMIPNDARTRSIVKPVTKGRLFSVLEELLEAR